MYIVDEIIKRAEEHSTKDWREGAIGERNRDIQEEDYRKAGRDGLNRELIELSNRNLIKVTWQNKPHDAIKITYRIENRLSFYDLKRKEELYFEPKQQIVCRYQSLLLHELNQGIQKEWIEKYYLDMLNKLEAGKIIKDGKVIDEFKKLPEYFPILRGIDELEAPVLIKVFSKKILHSAKKFQYEKMDKHVVSLARQYKDYIEDIDEAMSDKEILSQLLIEDIGPKMEIKGPLLIQLGKEIDLSSFIYGTVLSAETLKEAVMCEEQPHIKKVISIENETNFLAAKYEPDTLYVYTHGFFSPVERKFLVRLEQILSNQPHAEQIQYYHTGDLDYGGIRIYNYVKKNVFPKLQPLYMDVATYEKYVEYGEEIKVATLKKLQEMETPVELKPLVEVILKKRKGIEQESFLIK